MAIRRHAAPQPVHIPGGWDPSYDRHDHYAQTGGSDRRYPQRPPSDPSLEYEQTQIQQMTQAYASRLAQRSQAKATRELQKKNAKIECKWKETLARIERKYAPEVAQRKIDELYKEDNREHEKEERDFQQKLRKLDEEYDPDAIQRKIAKLDAAVEQATRKIQKMLQEKSTKVQHKHAYDDHAAEEELYSWRCKYATKEQMTMQKYLTERAELQQEQRNNPGAFEREIAALRLEHEDKACRREEKFRREVARWTQARMEAPHILAQKLYEAHAKMTARTHKESAELERMNKSRQRKDEEKAQKFAWIQRQVFIDRQVPLSYAPQEMGSRSFGQQKSHGHQNMSYGQQDMPPQSGGIGIPPFAIQGPGGLQVQVDPAEVLNSVGGFVNAFMSQNQGDLKSRMVKGAVRGLFNR